jgi:peptidyl-prolyl cis-trans isomerase A (cyclophilin A)
MKLRVAFFCICWAAAVWGQTRRVLLATEMGDIEVEVDLGRAPVTAANFLRYVEGGFYNGGRFHRAVKLNPDNQPQNTVKIEVIQAGINPERAQDSFPPIPLERTSTTGILHKDGVLSMARREPDTARSDFSIMIGDQPALDFGGARNPDGQGFAAFGRVVRGMEVVRRIHQAPLDAQRLTPPVVIRRAAVVEPGPPALLRRALERIVNGVQAEWGVYVKSLDSGEEVAIHADRVMDTMSVIKVPLLVEAFRQIEAGQWKLTDRVDLLRSDKRFGTGVLRTLDDGLRLSAKDLLTLMIIQSDNTATDMVFRQVGGPERVTATMREMGLTTIRATGTTFEWFRGLGEVSNPEWAKLSPAELFDKGYPQVPNRQSDVERFHFEGQTPFGLASPRDIGRLLEKIARNEAASRESCAEMLRILRGQQMNTRIPKYLSGAATPHKTGDFPPYIANDVGLIETSQARVVVVFFTARHRGIYAHLEDAIARASEQVWAYFNYRK